jgi:hypothetical protein
MSAPAPNRKSQIDAVLLKLPGVVGKKINGLDAYFVNDRMFACISGNGVGLRLPVATARELQFSREKRGGVPAGRRDQHPGVDPDRSRRRRRLRKGPRALPGLARIRGGRPRPLILQVR